MARRKSKGFRKPKAVRRAARKRKMGVAERRKREFTYRGYTIPELQQMPLYPPEDGSDQVSIIELVPSRVRRSLDRGLPRECEHFLERITEAEAEQASKAKTIGLLVWGGQFDFNADFAREGGDNDRTGSGLPSLTG